MKVPSTAPTHGCSFVFHLAFGLKEQGRHVDMEDGAGVQMMEVSAVEAEGPKGSLGRRPCCGSHSVTDANINSLLLTKCYMSI